MPKDIMEAMRRVRESNFPYTKNLIFSFIGGSQLHGAKLDGNDDMDIYGVFIEPPEKALGLDCFEHYVTSTAGNERRNGPEDVDITLYSLRRWAELAAKGNPTALHFLFAEQNCFETPVWVDVKWHKQEYLARHHARHFKGFADNQLHRLLGTKGNGKHGQRPEIVQEHGYDTKAGMHVIRLLQEGIELMRSGHITLPRPNKDELIQIRRGEYGSIERLFNYANILFEEIDQAESESKLPEKVDRTKLSDLISRIYLDYYQGEYKNLERWVYENNKRTAC